MTGQPLSRDEAAAALADARTSEARSHTFFTYRMQAPVMILWGVIWLLANLTTAYSPWEWLRHQAWTIGSSAGVLLTTLYYLRWSWDPQRRARSMPIFWRYMGTYLFIGIFIACAASVLAPFEWREPAAFWGLFWGFMYLINGVWAGWRLSALGAVMAGSALYAFYGLPDAVYLPVIGVTCGGGLILGGFWLRTA